MHRQCGVWDQGKGGGGGLTRMGRQILHGPKGVTAHTGMQGAHIACLPSYSAEWLPWEQLQLACFALWLCLDGGVGLGAKVGW